MHTVSPSAANSTSNTCVSRIDTDRWIRLRTRACSSMGFGLRFRRTYLLNLSIFFVVLRAFFVPGDTGNLSRSCCWLVAPEEKHWQLSQIYAFEACRFLLDLLNDEGGLEGLDGRRICYLLQKPANMCLFRLQLAISGVDVPHVLHLWVNDISIL